jgi:hypothetical protein
LQKESLKLIKQKGILLYEQEIEEKNSLKSNQARKERLKAFLQRMRDGSTGGERLRMCGSV